MAEERRVRSQREGSDSDWGRDDDDLVKRYEDPTISQFRDIVTMRVDGIEVTIPRAVPMTDAQGNILLQPDGRPIPRWSTIYDAAAQIWGDNKDELDRRIPVLCHRDHLAPVGVCRVCSVVAPKGTTIRGLVPACMHRVEKDMDVSTRCRDVANDPNVNPKLKAGLEEWIPKVRKSTQILTELLAGEHLRNTSPRHQLYRNELERLHTPSPLLDGSAHVPLEAQATANVAGEMETSEAGGTGLGAAPFRLKLATDERDVQLHPRSRPLEAPQRLSGQSDKEWFETENFPYSSRSIIVNHDNCILCDRCVRSCTDVKKFKIIGHTGKGASTRIAFDLDRIMNDSDCTQCGECATACPTEALVFRRRIAPSRWKVDPAARPDDDSKPSLTISPDFDEPLPAGSGLLDFEEIYDIELVDAQRRKFYPFRDIPIPYLMWNEGAVRVRHFKEGELIAREDEYASTAFLIQEGTVEILRMTPENKPQPASWKFWRKPAPVAETRKPPEPKQYYPMDIIVGELACFSGTKRKLSIRAFTDVVAFEVTRNLLDMMRRTPAVRRRLDEVLVKREAEICLASNPLFLGLKLTDDQKTEIKDSLLAYTEPWQDNLPPFENQLRRRKIVRYSHGQRIIREGASADDFYIVYRGFARVTVEVEGREVEINVMGEGDYFGEVALLGQFPEELKKLPAEHRGRVRTATVTAIGDVDLLRIPSKALKPVLDTNPELLERLVAMCNARLRRTHSTPAAQQIAADHTRLGLYQAQDLLVLDLERCTRCDECTKGCANSHGDGVSRLLREGLRLDKYLVATSCRSCHQPYCLDGCPVDAIHRKGDSLSIIIDDHCIGCSLCERNCPYGSIQMVPTGSASMMDGIRRTAEVPYRAVNCDLCQGLVGDDDDPFCVRSCPHEAAFRWDATQLKNEVKRLKTAAEDSA